MKVKSLTHDEANTLKTGVGNHAARRGMKKKTGKVIEPTQKPMSYESKNMVVHKHPAAYNQSCSKCFLRVRQNGSSRCKSCSLPKLKK